MSVQFVWAASAVRGPANEHEDLVKAELQAWLPQPVARRRTFDRALQPGRRPRISRHHFSRSGCYSRFFDLEFSHAGDAQHALANLFPLVQRTALNGNGAGAGLHLHFEI